MLGSGLLSAHRPRGLPLPGGAANVRGLPSPGPGSGGASLTGRAQAIQPTVNGFMGRFRHTAIPGIAPSKQMDPKVAPRGLLSGLMRAAGGRPGLLSGARR